MAFMLWLGHIRNPFEFGLKLIGVIFLAGGLNHLRDVLLDGALTSSFSHNLGNSTFTALPVGILGLTLLAQLGRMQRELQIQATTDPLTLLKNRRFFMDAMEHAHRDHQMALGIKLDIEGLGRTETVTLSVGIAQLQNLKTLHDAMCLSDRALYGAKSSGRARALVYQDHALSA